MDGANRTRNPATRLTMNHLYHRMQRSANLAGLALVAATIILAVILAAATLN